MSFDVVDHAQLLPRGKVNTRSRGVINLECSVLAAFKKLCGTTHTSLGSH
jgi:hypothetical protein